MGRLKMPTWAFVAFLGISVAVGFTVMGVGFGLWSQQLDVAPVVNTGNVDLTFISALTDDDGTVSNPSLDSNDNNGGTQLYDAWGAASSADPSATGIDPKPRYDKDVARCVATITNGQLGNISKYSVYPGYHCTAWFDMQNNGSVPVKVKRITIATSTGSVNVDPSQGPFSVDLDGDDGTDTSILLANIGLCQQIDPTQVQRMLIFQNILQQAPETSTLSFQIDVEVAQWNELGDFPGSDNVCASPDAAVSQILGPEAVVLPLTDATGHFNSPSFNTVGSHSFTFTWSQPPAHFDTAPSYAGAIPLITFNGVDEYAESPDADFWSPESAPFSIGAWIRLDTVGTGQRILAKDSGVDREWVFYVGADGLVNLALFDDSMGLVIERSSNAALSTGQWVFVVVAFDGTIGGTAANSIDVYVNGNLANGLPFNNPGYAGMENLAGSVTLGFGDVGSGPWYMLDGTLAGGPIGPFMVPRELTAVEIAALYAVGQAALNLP